MVLWCRHRASPVAEAAPAVGDTAPARVLVVVPVQGAEVAGAAEAGMAVVSAD